MKLNEGHIIDIMNLKRKNRIYEKNEDEKNKTIKISSYDDLIDGIHYLLNILQRDLLVKQVANDVFDFEQIYRMAKEDSKN